MSFYYHMYSVTPESIGTLNVYVQYVKAETKKKIFTLSGSQGNEWKRQDLQISLADEDDQYKVCIVLVSI